MSEKDTIQDTTPINQAESTVIPGEVDITGAEDMELPEPDTDAAFDIDSVTENATWDALAELRTDTAKHLVSSMLLAKELANKHAELLETDEDIRNSVTGLINAYSDVGDRIVELTKEHSHSINPETNVPDFYTGSLNGIDDTMKHLSIASGYTTLLQEIGNLSTAGYFDVFTSISVKAPKVISPEEAQAFGDTVNGITDTANTEISTVTTGATDGGK